MEIDTDNGTEYDCDICEKQIDQDEEDNHYLLDVDGEDKDVCGACFTRMKWLVWSQTREHYCKKCQTKHDVLKKEYDMAEDL